MTAATILTKGDYEAEAMNNVDNWSDPYGYEEEYYGGWGREDVESGLADAYEGDLNANGIMTK